MAKLRGRGVGAGMALGTAAVVRVTGGIPLLPEPPERIASLIATRRLTETPEVILVADDYQTALAIVPSLSWAKVVGIAAASAGLDAPVTSLPAVVDLPDLRSAVQDDMLLLVDATRGTVLADPDPVYLAQYTAEHDRIAPKRRLYLDDSHQPAQTIDGRAIQIVALPEDDLDAAVESGADALYVSLPLLFDPDIQRRNLWDLVDRAAGKPILLSYDSFLPLEALVQAAAQVDFTLYYFPEEVNGLPDAAAVTRIMEGLEQAITESMEQDLVCAMPRLAAAFVYYSSTTWVESEEEIPALLKVLAENGVTRLIGIGMAADLRSFERLESLAAMAASHFMPVLCSVNAKTTLLETLEDQTPLFIGAGVTGLLVHHKEVTLVKELVRGLSYAECREALRQRLKQGEEGA